MRDKSPHPNLIERRHIVLQIMISAVFMAIGVNILSSVIIEGVARPISLRIILSMLLILVPALYLTKYYLGEVIIESFPMRLLVNMDSGRFGPPGYHPALSATMVGKIFRQEIQSKNKLIPKLDDPILRDLIEWILINYLPKISSTEISPGDGCILSYPIPSPEPCSFFNLYETFKDNIFVKAAKSAWDSDVFFDVVLPYNVRIVRKRQKESHTAESEIMIKGKWFTPLDFLSITSMVVRIGSGATLLLQLEGYTPQAVILGEDKIICAEKIVEGDEFKELEKWIEIECIVTVKYKMRGWLFFHPKFRKWCNWAENVCLHVKNYFDFNLYFEKKQKEILARR